MTVPFDEASTRFYVEVSGLEGNERKGLWVYFGDTKDLKDLKKYRSVWRTQKRIAYDEWTNMICQAQEDPGAVHSVDGESEREGAKRKNTILQSFFRNDEVSPKNVPRTISCKPMQHGHAYREFSAGLEGKEDSRTRYLDDKESEPVRVEELKTAPRTSAPKLKQGSLPFEKIEASSNDVQQAVPVLRQHGPAFQAIKAGSKTAPRTLSPSLHHGTSAVRPVKATSKNMPRAAVSAYYQTSPSNGKAYAGFRSLSERRENSKAKYPDAKESDLVCTGNPTTAPQVVAPELYGIGLKSQVASPFQKP